MAEFSSEKEHQTEKNQSIKSIQWVTSQSGKVPEKAYIFHGKVIGRGVYNHGVHIGYIDTSEGGLIIGWAGCKVLLHKYQVLVAENVELMWIKISGRLQITGVKAGSENDRFRHLYIARVYFGDQWYFGKIGLHLFGAHFVPKGSNHEHVLKDYEVLYKIL